jgi:hypothetical protein
VRLAPRRVERDILGGMIATRPLPRPRILAASALTLLAGTFAGLSTDSAAANRLAARGCPTRLQPLAADSVASAAQHVLKQTRSSLLPIVEAASVASSDQNRGGNVKSLCGDAVWRRTVVVYLRDRAMGRNTSLAQRVFFVGRFPAGYRVWRVQH